MAPNLLLLAKKAVTPWEWCKRKHLPHNTRKLYYSTVPVPGIYAIGTDKHHYLVAIRPVKGKIDTEKIFVSAQESWDVEEFQQMTCELKRSSAATRQIAAGYTIRSNLYNEKSICSREVSFKTSQRTIRNCSPSIDSQRSYYYFTHPQLSKMIEEEKPVHTMQFIVNGTGGDVPHQQSPFRTNLIGNNTHSMSSLLHLGGTKKCGIQQIDINGFKNLRRPLRIEFCSITQRWMFSTEIQIRTEIVPMCSDITCMGRSHEGCAREAWRKMFVLDDGYSWVVVGKSGKRMKEALFRVDERTECMRRQCREEVRVSKWYLGRAKGRFLECDETADYMALIRYIQKEAVVKERGNAYREMIGMESDKLENFEWEGVVVGWDEKQIIERSLEKEKLKKVKVGKGRIQEAKGVEVTVVEVQIED